MDGQRFDDLTRMLARRISRRRVLRATAGGGLAGLLTRFDFGSARAAESPRKPRTPRKPRSPRRPPCASDAVPCGTGCCPGGNTCHDGGCCPLGNTICGAGCCPSGNTCHREGCCPSGNAPCGDGCCVSGRICCDGRCLDPEAEGGCDSCGGCPAGETCCAETCVDLTTDPLNCGECGVSCGGDLICCSGEGCCPADSICCPAGHDILCCDDDRPICCGADCCPANETCCPGDGCVDTASDPAHCGSCDRPCPDGRSCVDRQCVGRACATDDDCSDEECHVSSCRDGDCDQAAAACRLRTLVVVPSDKTDLPADDAILARMRAAIDQIVGFYREKAAGLELRHVEPVVLRANLDTFYFTSDENGNRAADGVYQIEVNIDKLSAFTAAAGYGFCETGWVTLVFFASTWRGGIARGTRCGPALRQAPDSAPLAGPGSAGWALLGQWMLDTVLTGEDSSSCLARQGGDPNGGPDYFACPANVNWGSIVHELGHAFSLGHPCEQGSWEAENWRFPPEQCAQSIMQSHWNYPTAGFDPREVAVLRLNKVFAV